MRRIKATLLAGLGLALGLAGTIAPQQAEAACTIDVKVDRYSPIEVQPEVAVTLAGCSGTLNVDVSRGGTALPRQTKPNAGNGEHLFWSRAEQRGSYTVVASVGSVRSSAVPFHIVRVPTAQSAGWKLVREETNTWGSFETDQAMRVWTEVRVGDRWSKSQERRTNASGGYTIPLTYGADTPGLYEFRVAGEYPGGNVIRSDSFMLERVARPTASSAGIKLVGEETNAWGTFDVYTPTRVWTEVNVGNRWSKSQERTTDRNGYYTIPLTYGSNGSGVTRWRVAGYIDGTVVRSAEFELRRVRTPSASSAGTKRVGEATNSWGTFDTNAPIRIWTEVQIGNRWSKSQERRTDASGGYTIPLTYAANQAGTTRWRVAGQYPEGVVRSGEFTLRRN